MALEKLLSNPFLAILLMIISIPVVFPLMAKVEGYFYPVVSYLEIVEEAPESGRDAVVFTVRFNKVRKCDFLGINWYLGNERLRLEFSPQADLTPPTRLPGEQGAGPWRLIGTKRLQGTRAVVLHRCHPLWTTYTNLYP